MTQHTIAVLTTIQPPTPSVRKLCERLADEHIPLLVVGDKKGPASYPLAGAELVTLAQQQALPFSLAPLLPVGHYSRKNVGYLLALERGARCLYETDDDNAPNPLWRPRSESVSAHQCGASGWVNVFRLYSPEPIWPRGFPLDKVRAPWTVDGWETMAQATVSAPIQQGLVNGSPDVDAVWRLVLDKEFRFQAGASVRLNRGAWCPFNTQSTWWWPTAFPLLYLPSHCSFRMTDIWRSLVAQRCLWELDSGVVFHGPEVDQERNVHNLMADFADEIPGYLRNDEIAQLLQGLPLAPGPEAMHSNLLRCYAALVQAKVFPETELRLVHAWLQDITALMPAPK